jgi:hypothetical protein
MNIVTKLSAALVFFTAFLGSFSAATAADSEHHRRVNDVDFYLAVIPAEITQGNPDMQARFKQHEIRYHIILSLLDSQTGSRITDAEVQASVSAGEGAPEQVKKLEPMLIMDAASYGNYFVMSEPGKYQLSFKVLTPERKYEAIAEFSFDRPKD